jgi:Family of unknown function (DUF6912)
VASQVRVYVPATLSLLAELVRSGELPAPRGTAVTDDLRALLPEEDEEGLEFDALLDAAELSLGLVTADPSTPSRRVVVAADMPPDAVVTDPASGPAAVRLVRAVSRGWVVAVHVDEASAQDAVSRRDVEGVDLLWYDASELEGLSQG